MDALKALIPVVFTVSLVGLVLAVGVDAERGDLTYMVRRPLRLLKALLAVNVIAPLAAAGVIALTPLTAPVKAGIVLMAISPMPPLVPSAQLKVGARKAYAYGLYVALAVLSVAIAPATAAIISAIYAVDLKLSPVDVARNVGLIVLLPLAVGIGLRRLAPTFASRAAGPIRTASGLLLYLAFIPMVVAAWPQMKALIGDGSIAACAVVILIALAGGHLLGGPDPRDRAALAVASATRHPGIALIIAGANALDPAAPAAILGFLLVGMIATTPYKRWMKGRPF